MSRNRVLLATRERFGDGGCERSTGTRTMAAATGTMARKAAIRGASQGKRAGLHERRFARGQCGCSTHPGLSRGRGGGTVRHTYVQTVSTTGAHARDGEGRTLEHDEAEGRGEERKERRMAEAADV
jgi:hypothetical protein